MLAEETKEQLIARIHQQIYQDLGEDSPPGTETFIQEYFRGLTAADLDAVTLADHCGAVQSLIRFAMKRRPNWPEIRLFNPSLQSQGWQNTHTVIEMVNDDMPFLLDSVIGELRMRDISVHLAVHPLLKVERNTDGDLLGFYNHEDEREGLQLESFMHIEIDQQLDQGELVTLETALRKVLNEVRAVVEDWKPMRRAMQHILEHLEISPPPLPTDEVQETRHFLKWIDNHHFTLLGYVEYKFEREGDNAFLKPVSKTGLGMLRKLPLEIRAHADRPLPQPVIDFLEGDQLVQISKASRRSQVHRPVPIDRISIKRFDPQGNVIGEYEFLGLFTSMAYSITASEIPLVRQKVQRVIDHAGFVPNSHNAKGIRHLLEHYPRDELFQIQEEDLYRFALRILELQLRPQLALFVRRDQAERFVSCMIFIPRDQHNTLNRVRMQQILEEGLNGEVREVYIWISDRPLAQLQFIVSTKPGAEQILSDTQMEELLADAVRPWNERLKEALVRVMSEQAGIDVWRLYGASFPPSYEEHFSVSSAIEDIPIIEQVRESKRLGLRLYRKVGAAVSRFHLRIFEFAVAKRLSNILPMLENMGLEVDREIPFEIRPKDSANPIWVRDFELISDDLEIDLERSRDKFQEAFSHVWTGEAENDRFSRLVLRADLDWREVIILRAYSRYLRQIKIAFSQSYMASTLARNANITRLLIDLFFARLDPKTVDREDQTRKILESIHEELDHVHSLDEDRILRRFLNLIQATLRTNYFQRDSDGRDKGYLSFKFDSAKVLNLPLPKPLYEIFVYSPRVEAVHLRSGKVARGGIRWSDRREDFRTEILGLVKAQIVKNTVIVPVGAKGGFVVKQPPKGGDREEIQKEAIECYKTLIRGMLDITDNLRGNEIIPPVDVVRCDGPDPYLVVAADKGTATFSDIANAVARDYGFWLDDAFASGGSAGYDHKGMGITARGGWESVKRHFRELDHDIQRDSFTAIGVGDMSGDVFGNGMILSGYTKLIAAFNHMHIFVDPDPDYVVSFAERQRLFRLPRSSWADYDSKLISEGGGVFERSAKVLKISPQIREWFELSSDEVSPDELIRAILRAKIDLIWFGGIGTYIKASHENDAQVGDRANDEVRIDADELRCKVIGEGANLGLTQAARIEFAQHGGRLNTDFIDNSGGVDCSDHEVNIKIALSEAISAGEFPVGEREELLSAMTDDVAELVLRDNYLQSQSISLIAMQGVDLLEEHARFIRDLERAGKLDRRLEGLPDDSTLFERREAKKALTRPEISVLLAYAKMEVYEELLDSDLPDEVQLVEDLVRYFPAPMRQRFRPAIERHRLRREIIATNATNSMVNRVGPTFVSRMAAETGSTVSSVARAYAASRDVFDLRALWNEIEKLDNKISAETQLRMMLQSVRFIERSARWFLRHGGRPLQVADCMAEFHEGVSELSQDLESLAGSKIRAWMRRSTKRLKDLGVPQELAKRVSGLRLLPSSCDVVRCAAAASRPVAFVGRVYFAVGERFGFDRLRQAAQRQGDAGPWARAAAGATIDDLFNHQAALTSRLLKWSQGREKSLIAGWTRENREAVSRLDQLLQDFNVEEADLAMLVMAERELRRLTLS